MFLPSHAKLLHMTTLRASRYNLCMPLLMHTHGREVAKRGDAYSMFMAGETLYMVGGEHRLADTIKWVPWQCDSVIVIV